MAIILEFNWIIALLTVFTICLVINDRAFSRRFRLEFIAALIACLILSMLRHIPQTPEYVQKQFQDNVFWDLEQALRVGVLLVLILIASYTSKYAITVCSVIAVFNICALCLNLQQMVHVNFGIAALFFALGLVRSKSNRDKIDYFFDVTMMLILFFSVYTESISGDGNVINVALAVITCVYYDYLVMTTYKKDRLTGLLLRHNLQFELEDLKKESYDTVLIDVDNFKLINDKYGHDRGDEVLVQVVNTVQKGLPKGSRMYRYGGDEFVIISRKVSREELFKALEEVNNQLSRDNLHVSFGIATHAPGEESEIALTAADKAMYVNKKQLKSEDIWDNMTGLYNYRGFLDEMDTFRVAVQRDNHQICLVAVDVDRLNSINMAYGYNEGNLVISTLARVLKSCLRGRDFIGHVGSDEFVIAIECPEDGDDDVTFFINKIQESMDNAYELSEKDYSVKLNVGKAFVEDDGEAPSEKFVNTVLYVKQEDKDNRRKNDVGEREQDYNDQDEKLIMDILDNNRLRYAYQPIVSAKDGSIVAYEALMRSDTDVMVSPLKILKYAERNKRSYEVERYSFFNVLAQIDAMELPDNVRIFINSIPGFLLNDTDYNLLKHLYGHLMKRMVVEITEQREIEDEALVTLNTRRDKEGFNLAMDDYGSGYSNTNSILRYMPQIVKLDRLLITGIDRNMKKQFFVNSLISFARENDMLILAEGVETESELKTVIRLGVDMIQGYITARPNLEIVPKIAEDIKKIIVDENLKAGGTQRMVYTASRPGELSVVQLAMENYTKINVSTESINIIGSTQYTADMVIRVKDGVNCTMKLENVRLNSVADEPCIDIGEGAHVTLVLEGSNKINAKGIHVPEGSSLSIEGHGELVMDVKGYDCYAIGANAESGFGKIMFRNSGDMQINVDGENCVGIGGGIATELSGIDITSGRIGINVAGVHAVGIGAYKGTVPINLRDCGISANFRVNIGIIVGIWEGVQDIHIRNFDLEFTGSGTEVCGIGSVADTSGVLDFNSGSCVMRINGQIIHLIGSQSGALEIITEHTRMEMVGEGDYVYGFGGQDRTSSLAVIETSIGLVINASSPLGFGTAKNNFVGIVGQASHIAINGIVYDLMSFQGSPAESN